MPNILPKESELLAPVLRLFGGGEVRPLLEAKLSRKRIDVVFVPPSAGQWTAVELKVRNWKKALWQAAVNTHLADLSYVALWHTTVRAAMESSTLFNNYGVGIVSVDASEASIVLEAKRIRNDTRLRQQFLLLDSLEGVNPKDGNIGSLSLLPT